MKEKIKMKKRVGVGLDRPAKKQTGITLIALIITIIVMLILVGVTISILISSNIIGSAETAVKGYQNETDKERTIGTEIVIGEKTYASIEDYLDDVKNENSNNDNLIKCEAGYNSINVRLYYLTYEEYVRGKTIQEIEQAVLDSWGYTDLEDAIDDCGSLAAWKEIEIDYVVRVLHIYVNCYEDALISHCIDEHLLDVDIDVDVEDITVTAPDGSTYELGHGEGQILGFNYSVTESGTYEFIAESTTGKKQKIKVPVEYKTENLGTFTLVDRIGWRNRNI